jgi:DNA-binding beta-propeller fold protein YncE
VVAVAVAVPLLFLGGSGDGKGAQGRGTTPAATSPSAPTTVVPAGPPVGALSFDVASGTPAEPVAIQGFTENSDPEGHTVVPGFGFVWVADFLGNAIYKINPDSGTIVAKLSAVYPSSIAVDGSDVWVASGYPGCVRCQLVRFDAATNRQVEQIDLDVCCGGMVIDHGKLWALATTHLSRVDLATHKVATFDIGGHAIAAGAGKVWILNRALATLIPVDESSGKAGRPIALPGTAPTIVTFAFDALWVTDRSDGVVTRLPVGTRGGIETVEVGAEPTGVAAGAGAIWVANTGDGTVTKIDPFGATAEDTVEVGGRPTRLAVAFGRVWVTNVPPHG